MKFGGGVFFSVKRLFLITLVVGFHYLSPLLESLGMSHVLYVCGYKSARVWILSLPIRKVIHSLYEVCTSKS